MLPGRAQTTTEGRPVALLLCYRALVQASDLAPIEALAKALEARGLAVLPAYVTSAIDGGVMDPRTADWARGQVAIAIRRNPTLCGPSPKSDFTWSRLNLSPPPAESRLAFEVLRFAYDDPYEKEITQLCRRVLYG